MVNGPFYTYRWTHLTSENVSFLWSSLIIWKGRVSEHFYINKNINTTNSTVCLQYFSNTVFVNRYCQLIVILITKNKIWQHLDILLIVWLSKVERPTRLSLSHFGDDIFTGLMTTQTVVSKHWRRVVSHPDSSVSHQTHLTQLQQYNMQCMHI